MKSTITDNCQLSVDDLPSGFYLFRATAVSGKVFSSKFLKIQN
jgi:hypothetical protein